MLTESILLSPSSSVARGWQFLSFLFQQQVTKEGRGELGATVSTGFPFICDFGIHGEPRNISLAYTAGGGHRGDTCTCFAYIKVLDSPAESTTERILGNRDKEI